jgi:transcription factor 1
MDRGATAKLFYLADDALKMIAPSLEKHKGCDILDINPGAGLWSQKLHEALQPRSHILLEPDHATYGKFLEPLTTKPGSKYKLVAGDTTTFNTYRDLIDQGVFEHQTRVSNNDAGPRKQNNTLLVTGTLMWDPKLPGLGFDSMAKQLITMFASYVPSHDVFHAYGPVRMLFWALREDLKPLFPQSSLHLGKSSVYLNEVSTSTEIVQPAPEPRHSAKTSIGREARYTLQSLVRAMKTARANGMQVPAHRRSVAHDLADDVERISNGTGVLSISQCTEYLKEQTLLDPTAAVGLLPQNIIDSFVEQQDKILHPLKYMAENMDYDADASPGRRHFTQTEVGYVAMKRKGVTTQYLKLAVEKDAIVDIGEAIYHLECKILGMTSQEEKEPALESLAKLNEKYEKAVKNRNENVRQQVFSDLDDRIGLCSPVARLGWDERPFEPLVMQPDEVWPPNRASLIDLEPKLSPGPTFESHQYFQDFVIGLFSKPAMSLPEALDQLQSGASQLIDNVPVLRDVKRGGRLDMKHMRIRMLTTEMIEDLCNAYREWPFRAPGTNHPNYFKLKSGGTGASGPS